MLAFKSEASEPTTHMCEGKSSGTAFWISSDLTYIGNGALSLNGNKCTQQMEVKECMCVSDSKNSLKFSK